MKVSLCILFSGECRRALAVAALALAASPAWAGGGPENVLVVVNSESPASMAVANHYVRLRQVPDACVLHLAWDPDKQTTDVETFRQKILGPVLEAIRSRGLAGQIDCVAYSADFPWAVDAKPDVDSYLKEQQPGEMPKEKPAEGKPAEEKPAEEKPAEAKPRPKGRPRGPRPGVGQPTCSINGLTYLHPLVTARNLDYLGLRSNQYTRRPVPEQKDQATLGFSSAQRFGPRGELVQGEGQGYLLCTVLGVTAGRGNSVAEIISYLDRAAAADGTHPKGTIYFVENGDIRSRVRQGAFPQAVKDLESLGVAAKIDQGVLPQKKDDVQGAVIGAAGFDWKSCGSTIRPGAICEHLTSFGGIMSAGAGQTPLSEFLRYGAAGSSGTVCEPFAIQDKFPLPTIHVHYARGCSLAEAFYQSVFGPYQLLIVGDPLCRPWAKIPVVAVEGVQSEAAVKGVLTLRPSATVPEGGAVERFELLVDGLRVAACKPGETLAFDTAKTGDGHHELRVVAVEAGPIQSRGHKIVPVVADNRGRRLDMTISPKDSVPADGKITVTAKAPGATSIAVFQNVRTVGTIAGAEGTATIDAAKLGPGAVRLRAVGLGAGGPETQVFGPTIEVRVAEAK